MEIRVEEGVAKLVAPKRTKLADLQALVLDKAPWILKRLSQPSARPAPKRFETGETLPYLGRSLKLEVETAPVRSAQARFDHWRLCVTVPSRLEGPKRAEAVRRAIVGWYRERALDRLSASVEQWWKTLGRGKKSRVLIRDHRRQWGSCAADGTLRFNWRLIMSRPDLIDYVVVHELAHLTHRNHSPDFWGLVTSVMPDARQRRKRLDETAPLLPAL